jgi:hypothetical protein
VKIYSTYGKTRGIWYTGWVTVKSNRKDDQIFRIKQLFSHLDFTYKQIKENIKGCVAVARGKGLGITEEDYHSLEGFMKKFVVDVESWKEQSCD